MVTTRNRSRSTCAFPLASATRSASDQLCGLVFTSGCAVCEFDPPSIGAIERLVARHTPPQFVFVPNRLNLRDIVAEYDLAARLGCSAFVTGPLVRTGPPGGAAMKPSDGATPPKLGLERPGDAPSIVVDGPRHSLAVRERGETSERRRSMMRPTLSAHAT